MFRLFAAVCVFVGICFLMMFVHPLWVHGFSWQEKSFWSTDGFALFRYGYIAAFAGAISVFVKLK